MRDTTNKTLGQVAFEAGLDVWLGWNTRDDGWDQWEQEDELTKAMWEAGAATIVKLTVPKGSVVVDRARFERLLKSACMVVRARPGTDASLAERDLWIARAVALLEPGDLAPLP